MWTETRWSAWRVFTFRISNKMEGLEAICPYCGKPLPCTAAVTVHSRVVGDYAVPFANAPCPASPQPIAYPSGLEDAIDKEYERRVEKLLRDNYPPSRYRYITRRHLRNIDPYGNDKSDCIGLFHLALGGREMFLMKSVRELQRTREMGLFPLGRPHFNARGKRRQFAVECRWRGKKYAKRKPKWVPWDGKKL